jgi:chorismate-pyruvate lyase
VTYLRQPDEATSEGVVGPRWLAQSARPALLTDVDFESLPVELRLLLISDGTLTEALEAHQMAPIIAEVTGQDETLLEENYAGWLNATPGARAVRRRTTLRQRLTERLLVQAEVHLIPGRLPAGFLAVLATCDKGLGAAFAALKMETRRELLWYGRRPMLGLTPEDARTSAGDGTVRGYRLTLGTQPICIVEETFPDALIRDSVSSARMQTNPRWSRT